MAILNYTTSINSEKTISEIQKCLVKHGGRLDQSGRCNKCCQSSETTSAICVRLIKINLQAVEKSEATESQTEIRIKWAMNQLIGFIDTNMKPTVSDLKEIYNELSEVYTELTRK